MDDGGNNTSSNQSAENVAGGGYKFEIPLYYLCVILVVLPGFVTNALALAFIIKDVRNVVFPAIVLLLTLIGADLVAVIFTGIHMGVALFVTETGYNICAPLSVLHTFFRLYSATLNAMMSLDRVLAICTPYFYKRRVHVCTWRTGCLVIGICIAVFALFPVVGLGDVLGVTHENDKIVYKCSALSYRKETRRKIYGAVYGVIGCATILMIVCGNSLVIHSILKMRKRVVPVNVELSSSGSETANTSTAKVTSFEIAFAQLMGYLALVYLVCGTPMNVSIVVLKRNL